MKLQFITHYTECYSYEDSARIALEGGCRWIQLRMKDATDDEIRPIALRIQTLCRSCQATFILDDRVELAKEIGADGVHLGKNDMPIAEARRLLPRPFIIGGTANTFEDIKLHYEAGADYIGCGPFRFTTTKKKLSPVLGYEGYRNILERMKEAGICIPVVGIGGITYNDIPELLKTGLNGIALSGSILQAENPVKETRRIVELAEATYRS